LGIGWGKWFETARSSSRKHVSTFTDSTTNAFPLTTFFRPGLLDYLVVASALRNKLSSPQQQPTRPPKVKSRKTHTMSAHTVKPTGPMAPQYITGVYIPSVILIVGTAAFKLQWLPLALAVCAALGGYQFVNNRTTIPPLHCRSRNLTNTFPHRAEEGP
jgi:hypothetical protein